MIIGLSLTYICLIIMFTKFNEFNAPNKSCRIDQLSGMMTREEMLNFINRPRSNRTEEVFLC